MFSQAAQAYCRQDWPNDPRSETALRLVLEWLEKHPPLLSGERWERARQLARCVRAVEMHGRTEEGAMQDIFEWSTIVGDVVRRLDEWLGKHNDS